MSAVLREVLQTLAQSIQRLFNSDIPRVTSLTSWKGALTLLLAGWVIFNLITIHVSDVWYAFNFRPLWADSDYPPLCSDSVKSLSWSDHEYPVLKVPDSNIRLLRVHPAHKLWGIEATLECASFLGQPQYRALSYRWGDSKNTKPITVNGKKMLISENLWKALYHIRDRQRYETLWIDAISINQNDASEKATQVPLMSFIFARAKEVSVWLGDHTAPRWVQGSVGSQWQGEWAGNKAIENWPVTQQWLSVLTEEQYWTRCWIVQEIAMASNLRVYSGRSGITWSEFVKLVRLYRTKVPSNHQSTDKILQFEELRQAKYKSANSYSLESLLNEFNGCFSTLNLDRIYAFIGMASDCVGTCIKVDYSLSPLQVYNELMIFWATRCFRTADEAIGTVRFAGLVRAILSREYVSAPKTQKHQSVHEDTNSLLYFVCGEDRKEICDLIPKLRSLLSYVDLVSHLSQRLILFLIPREIEQQPVWLSTKPEDARVWIVESSQVDDAMLMQISGRVAGTICSLGPTYREFIERPDAPRRWAIHLSRIWGISCNETSTTSARIINERLSILLGPAADYRLRNFVSFETNVPPSFFSSRLFVAFGPDREIILGLAPRETLPGDQIVTFHNTDAGMIIRHGHERKTMLIGRAGIVKEDDVTRWHVPSDKTTFLSSADSSFYYFVTMPILTRLSFDTVCLPGAPVSPDEIPALPEKELSVMCESDAAEVDSSSDVNIVDKEWEASEVQQLNGLEATDLVKACRDTPCRLYQ